ncbi:MAG TPA: glycosyltransferase family 4 protein [bacterium]|nr:glycosyltransferase family 4 protein [bacterium]
MCVVPSVWEEPFGIVALEAMASGVPLVVTDVGGLQDIVSHRHDGLICRRGDPQALAAALTELIEQPEFADTLRRHARATAQCYTWDTVYRKFSAILTDAAASAPAAAAPVS